LSAWCQACEPHHLVYHLRLMRLSCWYYLASIGTITAAPLPSLPRSQLRLAFGISCTQLTCPNTQSQEQVQIFCWREAATHCIEPCCSKSRALLQQIGLLTPRIRILTFLPSFSAGRHVFRWRWVSLCFGPYRSRSNHRQNVQSFSCGHDGLVGTTRRKKTPH
jgi:hypothetical protein